MHDRSTRGARRAAALIVLAAMAAWVGRSGAASPGSKPAASPDSTPVERHGSVMQEPGYYPAVDPESSSVRIGRRLNAPYVSKSFHGGARSLEELGRKVCRALDYNLSDSLLVLCVHEDEFRDVMWREFPQSRPATGVRWQDGWMFLWARLHGGSVSAMKEYGGHQYEFVRFERYDSTAHYHNFKLHNGLLLIAKDEEGQLQRFTWLRSAVERKGSFKIYSMKD
jgi:hypothetical protein